MKKWLSVTALYIACSACVAADHQVNTAALSPADRPRLILQITVDQLRGDLPTRYYDRLGEGGFRYLWEQGVVYADAHHAHANTETIVGHTTLATGAHPSHHGMVGNLWFDRETGYVTYNVEDARYRLLTAGAGVDDDAEVDPTQRAARSEGRSPAAILVTTFADELVSGTGGRGKAIGISVKDRGAIAMAGHAGTAYWFSKAGGEFVTSSYYLYQYPGWVSSHNQSQPAQAYANKEWALTNPASTYVFGDSDDRPWEIDLGGFGRVFPHRFGDGTSPYFTTWLTFSPVGDRLVLDFALKALEQEQLGVDGVTDYLSVSFSTTDYVGHVFGPSSLEQEDNLLQLDRTLADLLRAVDERVGLENTLIVLSADHGGPDTPGYLNSLNIPAAYVDPSSWDKSAAIERLKARFGTEGKIFETYSHPYLYFTESIKNDPAIDLAALEAAVVGELSRYDGVALAVSSTALRSGNLPDTELMRAVVNNFHPKRSGDIYVVFEPNHFINEFDGISVAATHGSPWSYDTWVPVVFAGMGLKPQVVNRRVNTVDVAPTLSVIAGVKPPSGAVGKVLDEAVRRFPVR